MTITPAAEPIPALKHRFVALDSDLLTGNAAPYYYRALMEVPRQLDAMRNKYGENEELSKWYATGADALPLDQLPVEKVREAVEISLGGILDDLTMATRRRECDWQLGIEEIRDIDRYISFRLPEFQNSRDIARLLALRTRLATAERRYDDAISTMRMNYRLAFDVAQPPYIVCGLIGVAISSMTNGTLLELIAAPDSPNLYWALSEFPDPPIDLGRSARFELYFGPRVFSLIQDAETTERSPQEWNRLFKRTFRDLQQAVGGAFLSGDAPAAHRTAVAEVAATGIALLGYTHAKEQLVAQGMDRDRVETMAVGQVMAIHSERNYRRFADDFAKLWYVPYGDIRKYERATTERLQEADVFGGGHQREVLPIARWLLPTVQAVRITQVRLERDLAAHRVIEALRMHAAANDGKLPARLEDITQVPVPLNPATGKPFMYRLEDTIAILELPSSDGTPGYHRRFEIQVAGKDK